MKKVNIVWNGVDGYDISNESVCTSKEEFKPFEVKEISEDDLPLDVDGDIDYDGVFAVVGGKGYLYFVLA